MLIKSLGLDLLEARFCQDRAPLWPGFQDHVEWRFRGATNSRKTTLGKDLPQAPLTGLCSKGKTNFLTERTRSADHRRKTVVHSSNRVQILGKRVSRHWLDNHERPFRIKRSPDVRRRANRIAHVVQRIEDRSEFMVTREILGRGDPKVDVRDPLVLRMPIGSLDGRRMQIEPVELTIRERFRHDEGGSAMPASDVRNANSGLELLLDTIKGRYPFRGEIGLVTWPKEPLYAAEKTVMVSTPRDARASPEALCNKRLVVIHG